MSQEAEQSALHDGARSGECSLCVLTNQFLQLLEDSEPTGVDLKHAASQLQTRKRRIYDVTNVLEGVGLLQKSNTSKVQWSRPNEAVSLSCSRYTAIQQERIGQLDDICKRMQRATDHLNACLGALTGSEEHRKHLYVSQQDVCQLQGLQRQQWVAIKAPPGSTLTIPDPHRSGAVNEESSHFEALVRARTGRIAAWLCSGHSGTPCKRLDHDESRTRQEEATPTRHTSEAYMAAHARAHHSRGDLESFTNKSPSSLDMQGPSTPFPASQCREHARLR